MVQRHGESSRQNGQVINSIYMPFLVARTTPVTPEADQQSAPWERKREAAANSLMAWPGRKGARNPQARESTVVVPKMPVRETKPNLS